MHTIRIVFLCMLLSPPALLAESSVEHVIQAFQQAYNARNIDAMLALADPSISWMYMDGDAVHVETTGHAALRTAMSRYFENFPSSRSELISLSANGSFASATEKAIWEQENTTRSQCSLSVYQLNDGLILNVWYYPAEACD